MNSSIKLFSINGIDLRLHITFPLILIWAGLQFGLSSGTLGSALFGVVAISLLFVLVTLHELGHSFVAQYFGVPVKQIVLSPLGGVAQLNRIPEKPWQEFIIAIAGPAVNVIVAIMMGLTALTLGISISDPSIVLSGASGVTLTALFTYVFIYNIFLALFNLLPAFPLDGGRIFRALLAMRLDYVKATSIAANVGRIVAVMMGLYGLLNGSILLVLIALFIFTAGRQEAQYVRLRSLLRGFKVQQVYSQSVYRLTLNSTVQQAGNMMILGRQRNFAVVDEEMLIGFLTQREIIAAQRTAAPHSLVSAFMRRDIPPVSPQQDLFLVQERLNKEQMEALPVSERGRFLGLVTRQQISDLYRLKTDSPDIIIQNQSA